MLKRSRVPVWATFTSTPSRDEMGPLDSFEAGKTYQITRGSLNRWISIGRAREATLEEIPAQPITVMEPLSGHYVREIKHAPTETVVVPAVPVEPVTFHEVELPPTIAKSDGDLVTKIVVAAVIPDDWRTLPLADLRALASKFSPTPVVQKKLCIEVIEAELAKRG
jgi:hypothetical protein